VVGRRSRNVGSDLHEQSYFGWSVELKESGDESPHSKRTRDKSGVMAEYRALDGRHWQRFESSCD